jgi:hypothetical protein
MLSPKKKRAARKLAPAAQTTLASRNKRAAGPLGDTHGFDAQLFINRQPYISQALPENGQ